jgi:cell wall-associated NlpC family hydrolase
MKKLWNNLLLFLSAFIFCFANNAKLDLGKEKLLIAAPVLNMHEECSEESSYVSQAIYGHTAYLLKRMSDDWALIETEDGYQGYAKINALVEDNPIYRTSKKRVITKSISTLVYKIAETEKPPIFKLPYSSRLVLKEDLNSNQDRWLKVSLLDGTSGWIQRGDVEKQSQKTLKQVIEKAFNLLERPYVWGGTSSDGFDCSGFVQTLYKQMGYLLPRDSGPQSESEFTYEIDKSNLKYGDLVFFGKTKIVHVGIYLGSDNFIHSGVLNNKPKTNIESLNDTEYNLRKACRLKKLTFNSKISHITDKILKKMSFSWKSNNPVPLEDLRYITLRHYGYDGCIHNGEIVVHKNVAKEIVEIFKELFNLKYPIEKMVLVDNYQADDNLSCYDNNTSAFCSRQAFGKNEWSYHSYGLAIDINPLLNPYHRENTVIPENGKAFLDRNLDCIGLITENDPCYKAFKSRGWKWAGNWEKERGYVDYQHFYKEL